MQFIKATKLLFALSIYATGLLAADSNLTITGTRISATCEQNATQETFVYSQWAGPCPAYSRAQALEFVYTNDMAQDT